MGEKSKLKEFVCKANISVKGIPGVKYKKDEFYTAEEVRLAPKGKNYKFERLDAIRPEAIDGTKAELQALTQKLQIKIVTLEAALTEYESTAPKKGKAKPKGRKPAANAKEPAAEEPQGQPILSSTGGQSDEEKL